ncbi:MAG: glycosyltransferase [Gammaproteobacteria bacterium]|nr:glycosyltransferase [Gammaproteobacteria bacterium]
MSLSWGGPTVAVSELTSELARQGVNCEIVTTRGYRVGINPISPPGVPIYSFDTGFPARLWTGYSVELSRFLNERAGSFDLIHIHGVWHYPAYSAFLAARKHKLPCVLTIHSELSEWGLRQKALKKRIYRLVLLDRILRNVNALHAITRAEKEQTVKLGYETPVILAPNGIEPAPFEALPDRAEFIQRFPVLKGKRIILFLGRLHAKKGLDILARSFSTIARRFEDAVLLVVGPNKFGTREKMEAILSSENLLDRTVFTGLLTGEDKLAAMSCADLFVLPSHSDVLGIAVLEAMAARLPVVITEGCEFPEVSEHGAGLVVEADEAPITEAITKLLSDADLCRRMGQQGRKLVTKRYTWQTTAATMANLYKTLVAGGVCQE